MKTLFFALLLSIPKMLMSQEVYLQKRGDFVAYFSFPSIAGYAKVNKKLDSNRININGRWAYFTGNSIEIRLQYGDSIKLEIMTGGYHPLNYESGGSNIILYNDINGACSSFVQLFNFKDGESCALFLNRSQSREQ